MNKNSIIFSTTLNFLITAVLLVISFIFLFSYENMTRKEQIFERYRPIIKIVSKKTDMEDLNKSLVEMNYQLFTKEDEIASFLDEKKNSIILKVKHKDVFKILEINGYNYLFFDRFGSKILVKDLEIKNFGTTLYTIFVFITLLLVISFLYIRTLKKLLPLKELKDKVVNLGDEKFDFDFSNLNSKDEVALLAYEFQQSAMKLKNIKESRNVFIRNIMHELKTPITKGKFLTQLEQNEQNKEKLKSVFDRLELLINEFATIEELISKNHKIEKKGYFLEDIIDNAKDILMIDDSFVLCEYENIKVKVNFKLFSIAVKNLIDNAIKYSDDRKVTIKNDKEDLIFENSGKALEGEFKDYLEPFDNKSSKESFGLGLYIVFNILKANDYELKYKYEEGKNIFICKKG